uniref:hypothetical protein n=1 Tax=Microbacterium proteolyticum TaxID=1572644 RepID=UPI002417EA52|nr:hypothetical protein [Microbacterium proteolyticum]
MSARSNLKALIEGSEHYPDTWTVYDFPTRLQTFEDATKPVAIVIEQRELEAGSTSPDEHGIPISVDLLVWVVVDGTRGVRLPQLEDELEAAAETMIRILEPLADDAWNGAATRDAYDEQKPAYRFPVSGTGRIAPPTPTDPEE